jgi:hypothetical protein
MVAPVRQLANQRRLALHRCGKVGYGYAVGDGAGEGDGEGEGEGEGKGVLPSDPLFVASSPRAWMPKTVDTLITDDTNPTTAERRTADRIDILVSLGKSPNRQSAVSIPRTASLLPSTAARLRYPLMIDETIAPIMGASTAKNSVPGKSTQRDVRIANTPPPTPNTAISVMLNGACPEGSSCCRAPRVLDAPTGLPQFEQ